ncbi:hypothetical protein PF006_g19589 [Phytophthora fragariae]|uniref:Uncharacterized protein n=2 Tax=Phytophthora fragariae TaxID=53985 RepID=A0A6A3SCI2_9STRA|nr:hypothetical protein PF006_g19589 [Phytophthora fragariae]
MRYREKTWCSKLHGEVVWALQRHGGAVNSGSTKYYGYIYSIAVRCGRALDGGAQHWLAKDRISHEQLKRIAEFGRVHGAVVREATHYVNNMEVQLKRQFEADCAGVRAQAAAFVAKTSADNEGLKRRVKELVAQVKGLRKQINVLKEEKTQTNYVHTHILA